jgi:DNA polymerase-3 subunit epsilon
MVVDLASRFFRLRECDDDRLHLGQRCLYADMDRCTVPCETDDPEAYAEEVARVRRFLTGRDRSVLDRLRARMERASEELDFEKAAEIRDTLEQLETILDKQRVVAAPIRRHNAALLHRTDDADAADVLFVRFGRFVTSVSCACPPSAAGRTRLREAAHAHFDPDAEPPSDFTKKAADEIRLLSHWTYAHRDELTVVRWRPDEAPDALAERIGERLAASSSPAEVA